MTTTVDQKGNVPLPQEVLRDSGVHPGDELDVSAEGERIVLRKATHLPPAGLPDIFDSRKGLTGTERGRNGGQLEAEFNRLAKTWKTQTQTPSSSVATVVMHPAYLEIIGLGREAIPLILRDLQREPNHWFVALKALAAISPVNPEDAGNIKKMTEAWLQWGRQNGYLK